MKITEMNFVLLTGPHQTVQRMRSYGIALVKTEDGRSGVGEPYAAVNLPTACREAVHTLRPLFVGQNAERFVDLIAEAQATVEYFDHEGVIQCLIGAIDWALHDLAAQRAKLPIHRFLNPQSRSSVELYASTGLAKWSIPTLLDELKTRMDEGYRTIKMRVGCGVETPDQAIARAQAAASCIEGQVSLGIDAGQQIFVRDRWSLADAKRVAAALSDLEIAFIEDPFLITEIEAYQELRRLNLLPVAGGEMFNRPRDFERYFRAEAFDIAQPDACVLPGPAASISVIKAARQHNLDVILHAWAGPVAQMQNIHAALAGDCDLVEFSTLFHPLLLEGLKPIWHFRDGRLAAPDAPGMGTAPIEELEAKYPFKNVSNLIA